MGTTLVIVELLIIGFQVLVWVGLLLWALLGRNHICVCSLKVLEPWIPLLAAGAFAAAYTLGLVFDRSVGNLSTILQTKLCPFLTKLFSCGKQDAEGKRIKAARSRLTAASILLEHPDAWSHVENFNRQTRLLRATCFNSVLTTFVLLIWCRPCIWQHYRWIVPLLVFLTIASGFTWLKSARGSIRLQDCRLRAYRRLHKRAAGSSDDKGRHAGAGADSGNAQDEDKGR